MFHPNYYKALYVDVPLRGTNMAARNQQKNLFLSFPTNALKPSLEELIQLRIKVLLTLFWDKKCLESKIAKSQ